MIAHMHIEYSNYQFSGESKKGGIQDGSKNKTMFSDKSELLEEGQESSHLSNDLYALEIRQIMWKKKINQVDNMDQGDEIH